MLLDSRNGCLSVDEILGYLYGELAEEKSDAFDCHLEECGECVSEFAELSQARYPVYEWKKLEFDPLPTPIFTLNRAARFRIDHVLASVRTAFLVGPFRFATGGIALILIAVALFVVFNGHRGSELDLKNISGGPKSPLSVEADLRPEQDSVTDAPVVSEVVEKRVPATDRFEHRALARSRSTATKKRLSVPAPPLRSARRIVEDDNKDLLPVLSQFEEVKDNSLRLTDIFDDIDGLE